MEMLTIVINKIVASTLAFSETPTVPGIGASRL